MRSRPLRGIRLRQRRQLAHLSHHPAVMAARALEHQRGDRDLPSLVLLPDDIFLGYADVLEEDLVETALAGHLGQRPHRDAGRFHVDQQVADALVLGRVGIGADEQKNPCRRDARRRSRLSDR